MPVEFTFGQVEAVCAAMSDISSDKRTAFTSRLKHLINPGSGKPGILEDERRHAEARPGRGKAAKFSFSQLMKVVIGVELLQAGTPPALAAKLVQGNWIQLRVGVHFALYNEVERRAVGDPREETYWIMAPEALRDLSFVGEEWFDHYEAVESIYRREDLLKHFEEHQIYGMRGHYRRQLILNGTAITRAAAFLISGDLHIANIQELQQAIYDEIDWDQKALDEAVKELTSGELSDETTKKLSKMLPVFDAFDEQWEQRVLGRVEKLSPSQAEIMASEFGSEVEISQEDLLELRKWDLIGVQQGELVITDLGQEVGAELRRRAGVDEPLSPRMRRQLERASDVVQNMKERGTQDGRPTMYPVEMIVGAKAAEQTTRPKSAGTKPRKTRHQDGDGN